MRIDLGVERVAILRARCRVRVFRVLDQLGHAERGAKTLPDLLAGRGDVDVAISGLEHAGRDRSRMIVAGLLWHLALHQPARRLKVEHEDLRLQERRRDVLAFLRLLALEQRNHDAERAEQPGTEVRDRNPDPHRPLPGQAGDRHQAAHALRDLVEAGPARIGAVLAEARNAAENDLGIDLAQRLVVDAEPPLHVGPEVLDHDVGLFHHAQKRFEPFLRLQVQRHAALVAMKVLEIRTLARTTGSLSGHQRGRLLDLDDVGTPVSELAHAGRARPDLGQVEDGKAFERTRGPWNRHFLHLSRHSHDPVALRRAGQTFPDLACVVYRGKARSIGSSRLWERFYPLYPLRSDS